MRYLIFARLLGESPVETSPFSAGTASRRYDRHDTCRLWSRSHAVHKRPSEPATFGRNARRKDLKIRIWPRSRRSQYAFSTEELEFEVWKQDKTGRFALLRTYPICRWSGDLGPKIKGRRPPSSRGLLYDHPRPDDPNSNYYLAINTGFPNVYDKANDRTGAFLMIHGDCASAGCYAMTDEQIAEIYALARESFAGGQKSFQIQALPFRMTPHNMARHRNSPHMAFWKMLKEGYDHFEVTHLPPKVDVCGAAMCSMRKLQVSSSQPSAAQPTKYRKILRRLPTKSTAATSPIPRT